MGVLWDSFAPRLAKLLFVIGCIIIAVLIYLYMPPPMQQWIQDKWEWLYNKLPKP